MNKERRTQIDKIKNDLADIVSRIADVTAEEQDYYDNMPENMQGGDKGEASQEALSELAEAESNCDQAISNLENASQ